MKFVKNSDIAIIGRGDGKNAVVLGDDGSITISSSMVDTNSDKETESISVKDVEEKILILAKNIEIFSKGSDRNAESLVYGESLVELLKWIIKILMTHKHPPNAPPIPSWFPEAENRMAEMSDDKNGILNKMVKSR